MASLIRLPNLRHGYVDLVRQVRAEGDRVSPRGVATRELLDATIVIEDPTDTLPVGVGRDLVPAIGIVEALQLLAGRSVVDLTCRIAPGMRRYTDDGAFWGAYGVRTAGQIEAAVNRLDRDPDTRQAVITIWDPRLDNTPGKRDYPCTIALQFTIRRGMLHMHTTMRSNDVWLGIAYDAFQFTQLQLVIAHVLGLEVGLYHHRAISLHIYEHDLEKVDALTTPAGNTPPDKYTFLGFGHGRTAPTLGSLQLAASHALDGVVSDTLTPNERRYTDVLAPYFEA